MFTGIIEDLGTVKAVNRSGVCKLTVTSPLFENLRIGESIAVNGVCLTISGLKKDTADLEVIAETLTKTNLGALKSGAKVNLERALKVGDRLSGHFVTGHIDCAARITEKGKAMKNYYFRLSIARGHMKFLVPKGSVALDGVSLTVGDTLEKDAFSVYLIPHTLNSTNLGLREVGDEVNVEFDMLGKYILNLANQEAAKPKITEDFLRKRGFC